MALCLLSKSNLKIVHCDLKPENIMLKYPDRSGIKLVDFGSSCEEGKEYYKCVQSMYYRAPEVLLGLSYGHPIDMWSVGCILAELLIGRPLFCGMSETDQMAKIVEINGFPPLAMLIRSQRIKKFFDLSSKPFKIKTPSIHKDLTKQHPSSLREAIGIDNIQKDVDKYQNFLDLLEKMLEYNPEKRIKPLDAREHQFFKDGNTDGSNKFQAPPSRWHEGPIKSFQHASMHLTEVPWPTINVPCAFVPKKQDKKPKPTYKPYICANIWSSNASESQHDNSPYSKQSTTGSQTSSLYQSPFRIISSADEIEINLQNVFVPGKFNIRPASHEARPNPESDIPCKLNVTPKI